MLLLEDVDRARTPLDVSKYQVLRASYAVPYKYAIPTSQRQPYFLPSVTLLPYRSERGPGQITSPLQL